MTEVDARGFSCPIPLMRTKQALRDNPTEITVLASDGTAKANVVRLLNDEAYNVIVSENDDEYRIIATK